MVKEPKSLKDYEKDYYFLVNGKVTKGNIFSVNYIGQEIVSINILSGENIYKIDIKDIYENPKEIVLLDELMTKL